MKKMSIILLSIVMFNFSIFTLTFAEETITETPFIKIIINGKAITFERTVVIMNNRTLLPFREVLNNLGVPNDDEHIKWNSDEKSIAINSKMGNVARSISMKIGDKITKLNGKDEAIDVAPVIHKDATYVPVRFVAQALGKTVAWDAVTKTVIINDAEGVNTVKDILTKVKTASQAIKRFKIASTEEINIGGGKQTDIKDASVAGAKNIEVDLENKAYKMNMQTINPQKTDTPKNEMYMVNSVIYTHSFTTNTWVKNSKNKILVDKLNVFGKQIFIEPTDNACAGLTLDTESPEGKYLLKGDVYISDVFNPLLGGDSILKVIGKTDVKFYIEVLINKTTNLIEKQTFSVSVGGNLSYTAKGSATMSDYNSDFAIKLPQEALDAKEIELKK